MFNILYLIDLVMFVAMQTFAEWQKYQLRQVNPIQMRDNDVIKKSGIFSSLVVLVASFHLTLNLIFTDELRSRNFYLAKDLFSFIVSFVLIPIIVIVNNKTMRMFTVNWIRSAWRFKLLRRIRERLKKSNQVMALSEDNNPNRLDDVYIIRLHTFRSEY